MTEVAMHPMSTIPSEELDDNDVPFKILNQDNLPITIIGESIFKPFGNDYQKVKPNGIVYPTRRIVSNLQENKQKGFTKSHGHVNFYESQNLNKDYSISHGNLNHCNSAAKNRSESTKLNKNLDPSFTKILDAKLRKLQKEEKITKTKPETPSRKPFITTVKKGHFLEPPPELASLFGFKAEQPIVRENKNLYAYASKPRVLHKYSDCSHQSRCETAAQAAASISSTVIGLSQFVENLKDINSNNTTRKFKDGSLPYTNLMVDRKNRGFNYSNQHTPTQPKWNPNFAYAKLLSVDKEKQESENRAAEARRRAIARRKAQKQQFRGSKLSFGTPSPRRKFENDQADLYLREILKNPPVVDAHIQTESNDLQIISPNRSGSNVETQIYPGDLYDFDEEVQPILEVLVGKTIEQALIEVLDEEELASLRLQQRRYLERRETEEEEARLQEANKEDVQNFKEEVHLVNGFEDNNNGSDGILLQGYVDELLPNVLDGLKKEGLTIDSVKHENNESFMPWLTKEVTNELHEMIKNPDILIDIVREILENRAEIYKVLQQASQEESADECPTNENIVIEDLSLKNQILKVNDKGNGITTVS